jgi:gliding motility-associated-like protein
LPTITTCATPKTQSADGGGQSTVPDLTGEIVATDNCDASPTITQLPIAGTTIGLGITTVTITVTDDSGNLITCNADINVVDGSSPTITTCAGDKTLSTDASCKSTLPDLTGEVVAIDNGSIASITQSPAAGTTIGQGVSTVTITVTDDSGNSVTCTAYVTVIDDSDPVISGCPTDITITADDEYCGNTATWSTPTASDNCSVTLTSTHNSGDMFLVGTTTVTYTAEDTSGNSVTCSFDVIVLPAEPPVIYGDPLVCIAINNSDPLQAVKTYYILGSEGSTFSWSVEGGTISSNYGDSIIVDWGVVPGEYELSVQEVSKNGCYSDPNTVKVIVSALEIELGNDIYICEGESFTLDPDGDYYAYEWTNNITTPTYTASETGMITCKVFDQYGCFAEDELFLEVSPLPFVDLGNDTSLCAEETLYLNAGDDGISFDWSTGETSQEVLVFEGFQEIWVRVENEYECENSDTIIINLCDPEIYFKDMPTAFTPTRQDGKNDFWEIVELQSYPDAVVEIYDRWGRLIWKSEPGYPSPWDGRDMRGNELPMDSYHYVILLNFGEDNRVIGSITVIR